MPTTAAAALSNTARAIGLSPRMSTTECSTSTSDSPMNGAKARRPEALGETITFGTPSGSACIATAPRIAPFRAAEAEHAVEPALGAQPQARGAHALAHQLDRLAAAARRAHRVQRVPAGRGDLGARHVGDDPLRLAEDPRVDDDRLAAERADAVAHVRDLGALRVEGPDEDDAAV